MGLTEGFVPYQILKKAGWMIIVWRLKITFGHVQQASSKIFWQILKQLLKLLTSTFIFLLLILTGKGAAVLKQEIFKTTSVMCLFQGNLINLPELSVCPNTTKALQEHCASAENPLRGPAVAAATPHQAYLSKVWPGCLTHSINFTKLQTSQAIILSPFVCLVCGFLNFFLMWK